VAHQHELSPREPNNEQVERRKQRQPQPPEWSVEAELDFGAGAHLERLANEVEGFMPY
jgi:hypothetical protein